MSLRFFGSLTICHISCIVVDDSTIGFIQSNQKSGHHFFLFINKNKPDPNFYSSKMIRKANLYVKCWWLIFIDALACNRGGEMCITVGKIWFETELNRYNLLAK